MNLIQWCSCCSRHYCHHFSDHFVFLSNLTGFQYSWNMMVLETICYLAELRLVNYNYMKVALQFYVHLESWDSYFYHLLFFTKPNTMLFILIELQTERRAPPCPADDLDISHSLLKALESDSDSPPWPSLHINIDNKVRLFSTFCCLVLLKFSPRRSHLSAIGPARERRSSCRKSLCTPLLLRRCSPITLNVTSSRHKWRQLSGSVANLTSLFLSDLPLLYLTVLFQSFSGVQRRKRRQQHPEGRFPMRPSMTGQYLTLSYVYTSFCIPLFHFLCHGSSPQVPELVSRLSCIQSDYRQGTPLAGPWINTRWAASQSQPKHQPQKTTGPTVQLVSTHNYWFVLRGSTPYKHLDT